MAIAPTSLDLRRPRLGPIPVPRMHPAFLVAQLALLAAALGLTALAKANPGPLPGDVGITLAWQHLVRPHPLPTEAIGAVSTINFPQPARYLTIAVVVALLLCRRWFDIALALITLGIAGTAPSTSTFSSSDLALRGTTSSSTATSPTSSRSPPATSGTPSSSWASSSSSPSACATRDRGRQRRCGWCALPAGAGDPDGPLARARR